LLLATRAVSAFASAGHAVSRRISVFGEAEEVTEDFSGDTAALEKNRSEILKKIEEKLEYVSLSAAELCRQLGVNPEQGLTSTEAEARLLIAGPNELDHEPPPTFWQLLLDQFKDLLVIMLIVAAIVSACLQEYEAAVAIVIIVAGNAAIGVKMEMGAEEALEALQKQNPPLTEVRRDGQVKSIPSEQIVPGDIVVLALGKKIPADLRLLKSSDVQANEMALTGESEPVNKDAKWKGDKKYNKKEEKSDVQSEKSAEKDKANSEEKGHEADKDKKEAEKNLEKKERKDVN